MTLENNNETFKILSIDGGGIKGLYTAKILQNLEEEYDCHLADKFDLICGTSTGGIIALALSIKIPAKEIVDFYKTDGPAIFHYTSKFGRGLAYFKQLLIQSKYSSKNLEAALTKVFGDKRMKDAQTFLCVPSFNVSTGENRVFKKDHSDLRGDNELKMVDVALATSAAPTYFPLHFLDNAYYVDGGIWANNPSLCGVREFIHYFLNNQYKSFDLLSVASLNHSHGFHSKRKWHQLINYKRYSFRHWGGNLFQVTLDGQSEFVNFFMKSIIGNLNINTHYQRIPSYEISPENVKQIDLDKATKSSLQLLEHLGQKQGLIHRTRNEIQHFFK
jgi:predicted acylesterase/phospholipase RssA